MAFSSFLSKIISSRYWSADSFRYFTIIGFASSTFRAYSLRLRQVVDLRSFSICSYSAGLTRKLTHSLDSLITIYFYPSQNLFLLSENRRDTGVPARSNCATIDHLARCNLGNVPRLKSL